MDYLNSNDVEDLKRKLESVLGGVISNINAGIEKEEKLNNALAEVERLKERVKDLEEAIVASHQTGCWGPIEDAYAAGGYPCLKHRAETELNEARLWGIDRTNAAVAEGARLQQIASDACDTVEQLRAEGDWLRKTKTEAQTERDALKAALRDLLQAIDGGVESLDPPVAKRRAREALGE